MFNLAKLVHAKFQFSVDKLLNSFKWMSGCSWNYFKIFQFWFFTFHIWNMESIGFTCKKKSFFYCKFSRFRTFYTLKTSLERKKIPSVTRRCRHCRCCRRFLDEILGVASSAMLSARKLKFWQPASFEPTWCTSYSELWNFVISLKNSGDKKLKNLMR
jgi:hypothetical protein